MTDNTNMAMKVAEVFLTAGHAFQKLGDLTLQLQSGGSAVECEENKWCDKDVDNLRDALTRFAHELDNISDSVTSRTTRSVKNDLKRQNIMNSQPMPVMNSASIPVGNTIIGHPAVRTRPVPYTSNAAPVAKRAAQVRPTQHFAQPVGSSVPRMRYAPAPGSSGLIQPKPQQGAVQPVPMIQIAPNNSNPVRTTTISSPHNVASSSPNTGFESSPVSQSSTAIPQQLRNAPSAPEPYRLPR